MKELSIEEKAKAYDEAIEKIKNLVSCGLIYEDAAMWAIKQAKTIIKDENDMGNLWYAERWLTFFKGRYTWKPSDEQIKTLEYYMCTLVCNHYKETLISLYQDLKKL